MIVSVHCVYTMMFILSWLANMCVVLCYVYFLLCMHVPAIHTSHMCCCCNIIIHVGARATVSTARKNNPKK